MRKLPFILDTDAGGDCDDMMALVYLIYAQRNLNVEVKAVVQSNGLDGSCDLIRTVFTHYGEPMPLIGKMDSGKNPYDFYCTAVTEKFGKDRKAGEYPSAVSVLRRALVENPGAVLCAIGPLTNIAQLIESKGDDISPLDGLSLLRRNCARVIVMAGGFVPGEDGRNVPEWNAMLDIPATRTVFSACPVPIAVLPFETGLNMMTGKPMMDRYGEETPLSCAYLHYPAAVADGGRHSWDPAAVVYAVEGCRDLFDDSLRGTVLADDEGRTTLQPHADGPHRILTVKLHSKESEADGKARAAAYIDSCAIAVHS